MIKRYNDYNSEKKNFKKFTDTVNEAKSSKKKEDKKSTEDSVNAEQTDVNHNNYQKNIVDPTVKANIPANVPVQPDVANDKKKQVEIYGKIAKFPKDTKAVEAFNFIDKNKDIKVKSTIWYLLIEKQSDQLQMVKFDANKGVNMNSFVTDLKSYYSIKFKDNTDIVEAFNSLSVMGNDKFSTIANIKNVNVDGKKLITLIIEDLVKLLK
jgi:hypothetical protein